MTACDETTWIQARLTATKALIEAYEAAILALSTDSVQMYQLDTGQTRQMVTKANLTSMRSALSSLWTQYDSLRARLGCDVYIGTPAF